MNKNLKFFLYVSSSVLVLLLSLLNIQSLNSHKPKVLGVQVADDSKFWQEFLEKHPTYIDGWIELERFDKVSEIDPNYFQKP